MDTLYCSVLNGYIVLQCVRSLRFIILAPMYSDITLKGLGNDSVVRMFAAQGRGPEFDHLQTRNPHTREVGRTPVILASESREKGPLEQTD